MVECRSRPALRSGNNLLELARNDSGLGRQEVPRSPNSRLAAHSFPQYILHSFRQRRRSGPQRVLFQPQLRSHELPGRLCRVGLLVQTAAVLDHSYGQLDAVVVHHRARCTVVDIAAADTAVVDHVRPGLIVELVAAVHVHVLWEQSCALVAAAVVAAAIVGGTVGSAGIAGSEEALVFERMVYSARVQYTIVAVLMIRQIQLMHLCELRVRRMLEPRLQNEQHIPFREIVFLFRGLRSHWCQVPWLLLTGRMTPSWHMLHVLPTR